MRADVNRRMMANKTRSQKVVKFWRFFDAKNANKKFLLMRKQNMKKSVVKKTQTKIVNKENSSSHNRIEINGLRINSNKWLSIKGVLIMQTIKLMKMRMKPWQEH